eukprot:m.211374 g.211374  ORF g.211374 m.211374 type:complete len:405 (-) comp18242_c0_seq1:691-1905(-)
MKTLACPSLAVILLLVFSLVTLSSSTTAQPHEDDDYYYSQLGPSSTSEPSTPGQQETASQFVKKYTKLCVAAGELYKEALPCPMGNKGDCYYTISISADSWSDTLEGRPDVTYVVVKNGQEFTAWSNGKAFSSISLSHTDDFWADFAVPAGETFIFVARNDNWLMEMTLSGNIEFFPNVIDAAHHSSDFVETSSMANNSWSEDALFAFGFYMGLMDKQPYQPPNQACISSIEGISSLALSIDEAGVPDSIQAAQQLLFQLKGIYENFHNATSDCQANDTTNQCPGSRLEMLKYVISAVEDFVPQLKLVDGAARILMSGYDIMEDLEDFRDATGYDRSYSRGHILGKLVVKIKAFIKSELQPSRRRSLAANVDLRENDGVLRTLQEWRSLYPHDPSVSKNRAGKV